MKAKLTAPVLALLSAAVFYLCSAPRFLQGGDTSEMVAGARHLLVVHPPGFPIWIRLLNLWLNVFPLGTDFWRASVLTALIAVAVLALFAAVLKTRPLLAAALIFALGLSPAFLYAAILPDVFALHALFTAALAAIFLFAPEGGVLRMRIFPLTFALSFAHHPTVIFLLPLLIHEFVSLSGTARPKFTKAFIAGGILAGVFYFSLLTLNTRSPYSWGELNGAMDVIKHALRADYGTFQLKAQGTSTAGSAFANFLLVSLLPFAAFLGLTAFALKKNGMPPPKRFWTVAGTAFFASAFFLVTNVAPRGLGAEVLLRFQLMPLLLLLLACAWVWRQPGWTEKNHLLPVVALLPALLWLAGEIRPALAMRDDSVTEDFAANALAIAAKFKPTLILADDDAAFFAMRARIQDLKLPEVAVAEKSLFFHPWFYEKTRVLLPGFALADAKLVHLTKHMNVVTDLFEPNAAVMHIMTFSGFQDGRQFQVDFQGLGRIIGAGQGQTFNAESLAVLQRRTRYARPPSGPQGFSRGRLDSMYSHYYLTKSVAALNPEDAAKASREALDAVPYAAPARQNLCVINQTPRCEDEDVGAEFF